MRRIVAILLLFALARCTKYSVECELVVQPYVMVSSGSDVHTPAYMARMYVFYIDEHELLNFNWRPESYADADAGLIRHRTTGKVRSHGLAGGQSAEDGYIHLTLTKSPMVLVAVDPVNKFYAWRTFMYEAPLERILVPVIFRIYQGSMPAAMNDQWSFVDGRSEDEVEN